jgi:hypothetical protein
MWDNGLRRRGWPFAGRTLVALTGLGVMTMAEYYCHECGSDQCPDAKPYVRAEDVLGGEWDRVETSPSDAVPLSDVVEVYDDAWAALPNLETLRRLLMEWQRYALTMEEAGSALPSRLMERTTAALDATSV